MISISSGRGEMSWI